MSVFDQIEALIRTDIETLDTGDKPGPVVTGYIAGLWRALALVAAAREVLDHD